MVAVKSLLFFNWVRIAVNLESGLVSFSFIYQIYGLITLRLSITERFIQNDLLPFTKWK